MGERYKTDFTIPTGFPETLKDLNREILRQQPKDIYQFCSEYFNNLLLTQQGQPKNIQPTPSQTNTLPNIPKKSNMQDTKQVFSMGAANTDMVSEDTPVEYENLSSDDDEAEDALAPPPPQPTAYNRGRRTSVSAESMAPSSDQDYIKTVIPKTEEQRKRIEHSIRNNFLFKSLDEEQYVDVVDAMAEKRVMPGEDVIKQGGIGDFFYVAETGTFEVLISKNKGEATKVFEYGPGGSFGELALMYNAPRAATVRCSSESVLWALDRVTFRRILMENTSRKRRMYENFLEEVQILESLESYERHKIADALESVVFKDGEVVIKQGDLGENFFIIESGDARVTVVNDAGITHELPGLKKGNYFGELALLTDKPRKATITANGRLKVATLGKKAFVRLLGPVVDIIKRNISTYQTIYQKTGLSLD
jgi:cAMP-dependent protein kinase regulator